ncbi:PHP domain-containing protein [Legionella nagasakiensis]|uniref:PHP domain-containing protein n=1 Tax=Legionella nagasakiensis TaxID=535290 RepID=UPI0010564E70|nr:PHP domain-containing protein [Legionella nagasakiensis]
MIDLHCHSYFSDGALSPADILKRAMEAGIKTLALTDHDTMAGLVPLHAAVENNGSDITIINGIELSVRWKKYDIHIIGLNVSTEESVLNNLIKQQQKSRTVRALKIAERLEKQGVCDAYNKACAVAGHDRLTRPHFAQVLLNEGLTKDIQSGFKRYLARGRSAYVPTPWITIEEAVTGIMQAGGEAVIAHPLKYSLTRTKLHELIIAFKMAGGIGMEVVSGDMTLAQLNELALLCERFDLLASTGSDFHRDDLSRTALGRQSKLPLNCKPIWHQWTI